MIVRLTPKFLSRLLCHLLVATPDNMKDIMSIKKRLEQKSAINGKAGVAIMSDMLNDEKIRNLVIKAL